MVLPDEDFHNKHRSSRGSIHDGSLNDLSIFYRNDNVDVVVNWAEKKVTMKLPFKFDNLKVMPFHHKDTILIAINRLF